VKKLQHPRSIAIVSRSRSKSTFASNQTSSSGSRFDAGRRGSESPVAVELLD